MSIDANGYPLSWPAGWKRTETFHRRGANFGFRGQGVTVDQAVNRILSALKKVGVRDYNVIVSTNLQQRRDGLPRSDQRAPADPGAAVYWNDAGEERCIAVDHYTKVEENLAAIAATLDAMRAIERHGGAQILNRAFAGFTALPPPGKTSRTWRDVLGFHPATTVTAEDVKTAFRKLAFDLHPDRGGTSDQMAELNAARDAAAREITQ